MADKNYEPATIGDALEKTSTLKVPRKRKPMTLTEAIQFMRDFKQREPQMYEAFMTEAMGVDTDLSRAVAAISNSKGPKKP